MSGCSRTRRDGLPGGRRDRYSHGMAEPDKIEEAKAEAEMAAAFYEQLVRSGVDERAAREMATGYVIARQRREKRESWELEG